MIADNVLALIGSTPLVMIHRVNPYPSVRIAAKLEVRNPGGSIKDRVALAMIEAAEASGELKPDKTIIEATSGNTGIGLAMVCAVKGYKLKLLMPASASEERKRIMKAYGAEIELTPGHLGTDGAIEEAYRLAREEPEKYVLMDQFNNPASIEAHYQGTAQEIWDQTKGKATHVVAALGTSGTVMGLVKRLKELSTNLKVVAVEPYAGHKIQGLKNMQESYPPGIFDRALLDEVLHVEDEEAFAMCRRLAREEGIFAGMSSGAAMAGAVKLASTLESGLIVVIFPDSGDRYLSTPLFAAQVQKGMEVFDVKTQGLKSIAQKGVAGFFTFGPGPDRLGDLETWRRIIVLDVMARSLAVRGIEAKVSIGLADFDDQSLSIARKNKQNRNEFSEVFLTKVRSIGQQFGLQDQISFVPASTGFDRMISMCRTLLARGMAYEKLRSVYYDVLRDKDYGSLSSVDLEKLSPGKTVDLEKYVKDNPRDVTLLKRASLQDLKLGECCTTEWGNVRPTWYLQMAAVAVETLPNMAAVLGGQMHAFPHLENMRGIWTHGAKTGPTAWMISGPVVAKDGEEGTPEVQSLTVPMLAVRAWFLSGHYRKPLQFSSESLAMWERNWRRLQECAVILQEPSKIDGPIGSDMEQSIFNVKTALTEALDADLELHRFWPVLFQFCRMVNKRTTENKMTAQEQKAALKQVRAMDQILGVVDWQAVPISQDQWPAEVAKLVQEREEARKKKDYDRADELREEIRLAGFHLEDTSAGPRLQRG